MICGAAATKRRTAAGEAGTALAGVDDAVGDDVDEPHAANVIIRTEVITPMKTRRGPFNSVISVSPTWFGHSRMAGNLKSGDSERWCDEKRPQGDAPSPGARQEGPVPDGVLD